MMEPLTLTVGDESPSRRRGGAAGRAGIYPGGYGRPARQFISSGFILCPDGRTSGAGRVLGQRDPGNADVLGSRPNARFRVDIHTLVALLACRELLLSEDMRARAPNWPHGIPRPSTVWQCFRHAGEARQRASAVGSKAVLPVLWSDGHALLTDQLPTARRCWCATRKGAHPRRGSDQDWRNSWKPRGRPRRWEHAENQAPTSNNVGRGSPSRTGPGANAAAQVIVVNVGPIVRRVGDRLDRAAPSRAGANVTHRRIFAMLHYRDRQRVRRAGRTGHQNRTPRGERLSSPTPRGDAQSRPGAKPGVVRGAQGPCVTASSSA